MAQLIHLARHRTVESDHVVLAVARGDSDLRGVAGLLWFGSVARVALEITRGGVFGVEASLALTCAIVLPIWYFQSRNNANAMLRQSAIRMIKKA